MANNSKLVTTAATVVLLSNGTDDVVKGDSAATAFVVSNGDVGDDTILDFRKNDSLINYRALDQQAVSAAGNGTINVDAANIINSDAISIVASSGGSELSLRYLGHKDGGYAYADASVRLSGFTEGYVTDDVFDAALGANTFFYDNALGLNLGFDTINGFGADDVIVTTRRIYDADGSDVIGFGANRVLDLSGEDGPKRSDSEKNPGGQIDVNGSFSDVILIDFLYAREVSGVMYYYYGLDS